MTDQACCTALLDACVLFPMLMCDALISVAVTGLFVPRWSSMIDDEWIRSAVRSRGVSIELLGKRRDAMRRACPGWEVRESAWRSCMPGLELPDADDRHVLAAALATGADYIATANLKDFPAGVLKPLGVEAIHPDDFLHRRFEQDAGLVLAAFTKMRARRRSPPLTAEALIDALARSGLPRIANDLRAAVALF